MSDPGSCEIGLYIGYEVDVAVVDFLIDFFFSFFWGAGSFFLVDLYISRLL